MAMYVCMLHFQRHCNSKLAVQEAELRCTLPCGVQTTKVGEGTLYITPQLRRPCV